MPSPTQIKRKSGKEVLKVFGRQLQHKRKKKRIRNKKEKPGPLVKPVKNIRKRKKENGPKDKALAEG